MRNLSLSHWARSTFIVGSIALLGAAVSSTAQAMSLGASGLSSQGTVASGATQVILDTQFDDFIVSNFVSLGLTEMSGDIGFSLHVTDPALGPAADLNEFYFNLLGSFTGVSITSTDPVTTPYVLVVNPMPVRGGYGTTFDFGVNLGDGDDVNGQLKWASFTLSADQSLTIADLMETSNITNGNGTFDANFAQRLRATDLIFGPSDFETVGGAFAVVPEPSPSLLIVLGLLGLLAQGGRLQRHRG